MLWQRCQDFTRLHLRQDGKLCRVLQIFGNPINRTAAVTPELFEVLVQKFFTRGGKYENFSSR